MITFPIEIEYDRSQILDIFWLEKTPPNYGYVIIKVKDKDNKINHILSYINVDAYELIYTGLEQLLIWAVRRAGTEIPITALLEFLKE